MAQRWNGAIHSINAAALLLGAAGLFSRLLGVLRDRLLAAQFGASRELDIYYAAFQIPDLLFNLLLLGAAAAAIIPVFIKIKDRSLKDAQELISGLSRLFFVGALLFCGLAGLLAPYLMQWIAPGFSPSEQALAVRLTRIMLASPIFLGLSGIVSSVIQTYRRFFIYALSALFYNLGIIAGILFFVPFFGLIGLAWGVVLGALLHLVIQLPSFISLGFYPNFSPRLWRPFIPRAVREVITLSFPRMLAGSLGTLTTLFLVALASTMGGGSISVFQFANNLRYVPVGMLGVSFAVAAFPALSEYASQNKGRKFYETWWNTLHSILFWILPFSILFFVLRAQIVRVALGAGNFNWTDTRLTTAFLGILSIAILTESILPSLLRAFYALEVTRTPLIINIAGAIVTVILAAMALLFFQAGQSFTQPLLKFLNVEDVSGTNVLGIGFAVALGGLFNFFMLLSGLKRAMRLRFGAYELPSQGIRVLKMAIVAILAGALSFGTLRFLNLFVTLDTFRGVFIQGFGAASVGLFSYGGILYIWGNSEIRNLILTIRRHMLSVKILPQQLDGQEHP